MHNSQLEMERRIARLEKAVGLPEEADEAEEPSDLLSVLDGNIGQVEAALPDRTDDELLELREAEQNGKTRDGAIRAIDAEIARRAE